MLDSLTLPSSFPEFRGLISFGSSSCQMFLKQGRLHRVLPGVWSTLRYLRYLKVLKVLKAPGLWISGVGEFPEHNSEQWFYKVCNECRNHSQGSSAVVVQVDSAWTLDLLTTCLVSFKNSLVSFFFPLVFDLLSRNAKYSCFQRMNINYVGTAPFHFNAKGWAWGEKSHTVKGNSPNCSQQVSCRSSSAAWCKLM